MQKISLIKKLAPKKSWLITDDNPRIRLKSEPIQLPLNPSDWENISKMVSYIDASYDGSYTKYNITPGVAIASNQIDWQKRVVYLHFDDENGIEKKWLLANPEIVEISDEISYLDNGEGCLSVPETKNGIVPRKLSIKVKAYDLLNDRPITIHEQGFSAIVLQHELDHLDGVLYYDHINVLDANYTNDKWKKI